MKTAFQKISRKAVREVLCDLPDSQYKRRLKRKFLCIYAVYAQEILYANKAFGYYILADGTMSIIIVSEGMIQGCNFGTLFSNLGYTLKVLKPVNDEFYEKGLKAAPACIDASAAIGEPGPVSAMLTRIMSQASAAAKQMSRTFYLPTRARLLSWDGGWARSAGHV